MGHDIIVLPDRRLPSRGRKRLSRWAALLPRRRSEILRSFLDISTGVLDFAVILGMGLGTSALYHWFAQGTLGPRDSALQISLVVAFVVVVPCIFRGEYTAENYLAWRHHPGRLFSLWTIAFLSALTLGFLTKTTGEFSRASALLFYTGGFAALLGARFLLVQAVRRLGAAGSPSVRRLYLVGFEEDVSAFTRRTEGDLLGLRVIGATVLRRRTRGGGGRLAEDIALAVSTVRFLRPDDVFLLLPWSSAAVIERCVDAFLGVPTALHLRPELVMERFTDLRVVRVGQVLSLNVARRPLSRFDVCAKRVLDLVVASAALVLLAPFLALVALLIRLDSPGPVLFRQQRYGFNQEPFRIFKFRSMTTFHETAFEQARPGDLRVTRVGRILRRWNIDELPQLLNVLKGEMSLVGPRPHALAHDRAFERRIARYARRHNVKPGITGWAQVHGCRGETRTDEAMRSRVEHDLWYIDHWSLWLDLKILVLTVVSPKAYRNAI